jgi:hypothetical protein
MPIQVVFISENSFLGGQFGLLAVGLFVDAFFQSRLFHIFDWDFCEFLVIDFDGFSEVH